jgi:hypothetical protein
MKCAPAVKGAKCVPCSTSDKNGGCDVMIFQVGIPRKSLGIEGDSFYVNVARTLPSKDGKGVDVHVPGVVQPGADVSCWRGNERMVADPEVYGKMILPGGGKGTGPYFRITPGLQTPPVGRKMDQSSAALLEKLKTGGQ